MSWKKVTPELSQLFINEETLKRVKALLQDQTKDIIEWNGQVMLVPR